MPPGGSLDQMAMAFCTLEDKSALALANSILAVAPKNEAATAVVNDLNGRKKRKRFGVRPDPKPPADLDAWIKGKQTTRLIAALEDVCAEQDGWPGGVDLTSDWRVEALIHIGDPAVPGLIDVIEKDERLTRSVHSWRPGMGCHILGVREAALSAVMSILRVRVFEAGFTGDNFTGRGKEAAKETAAQLRRYWARYGKFPFDERMMQVLRDPALSGKRLREAATSLAYMDDEVRYGTTVWTDKNKAPVKPRENPAITKFSNPTAAEAIFAAMKRDLAACDASKKEATDKDYERREIEGTYADALVGLGDKRIAAPLAAFAATTAPRHRLLLAGAANALGDPAGLVSVCREFAAGKWTVQNEYYDLDQLLNIISSSGIPEAESALSALEDTKHPLRKVFISRAARAVHDGGDMPGWIFRTFTVRLLVGALRDDTQTGWMYSSRDGSYNYSRLNGEGGWATGLPEYLSDDAARRQDAPELISDQAAVALVTLIWTLPRAHPLFKDNAARMEKLRDAVSRYRFRPETGDENSVKQAGEQWSVWPGFLPDIPPLNRIATQEDVASGKAIFTLNGDGTLADLKLPARAVFAADKGKDKPRTAIIVQAEKAGDGSIRYGALFRGGVGMMTDKELTDVKPLEMDNAPEEQKQ